MLLPSGNDAAIAIAEWVGGSESGFVNLMNQRAASLGLTNTAYRSPAGYDPTEKPDLCFPPYSSQTNCGHYTSARDLANLAGFALQQPVLSQAVQTTSWNTTTWRNSSGSFKNQNLTNTNLLLSSIPYTGANGVKTGEGPNAGWCIVARATRSNRTTLTVIMDTSPDNAARHNESIQLLDYGFAQLLGVQALANGSFEQDASSWTITGHCGIVSGAASAGTKSVGFNAAQTVPLGTVAQSFATVPGQAYTLTFDYGITSPARLSEQRLEVTVSGNTVRLSQTVSQSSSSSSIQYVQKSFTFVADRAVSTLTFRDVSTVSDSVDSFLDNVQITPDPLRVLGVTNNGTAVGVAFYGVQGRTYRLERTADLLSNMENSDVRHLHRPTDPGAGARSDSEHGRAFLSRHNRFLTRAEITDCVGRDRLKRLRWFRPDLSANCDGGAAIRHNRNELHHQQWPRTWAALFHLKPRQRRRLWPHVRL